MQLTLMRHGIAESFAESDRARNLVPEGRRVVAAVADTLAGMGWTPGVVVSSPLVRARQTAEIVHERFTEAPFLELEEVLAGGDELLGMLGQLGLADPLVVGHMPTMALLGASLLGAAGAMPFPRAGVACFRVTGLPPRGPAQLEFFLPPTVVPGGRG